MKKSYLIIIIVAIVVTVVAAFYVTRQNKKSITSTTPTSQSSVAASPTVTASPATGAKTVTVAEVAKHNSKSDCWVIIGSEVYNVTSVIPSHPGGADKIIAVCGGDGTQAFTSREGQGPHPSEAQEQLDKLFVGNLLVI